MNEALLFVARICATGIIAVFCALMAMMVWGKF